VKAVTTAIEADPPITDANHYLTTALLNSPKPPAWADKNKITEVEGAHTFMLL
jgi:hypothetical protein